jgi:hypothetical protein
LDAGEAGICCEKPFENIKSSAQIFRTNFFKAEIILNKFRK